MSILLKKFKEKSLGVFVAFLFFLAALSLINMIEGLFWGSAPFSFYTVIIAAGVIAKTLIMVAHLPWVNLFPNKPLIYNMLWKTALYALSTLIVRVAIRMVPALFATHSFSKGWARFFAEIEPQRFIAIQLCYLVLFFIFVVAEEICSSLGGKHLRKLIFGK